MKGLYTTALQAPAVKKLTSRSRATALSVPTLDHYLPMVLAIGLQEKTDGLEFVHEGFQNRSVSMRCFKLG